MVNGLNCNVLLVKKRNLFAASKYLLLENVVVSATESVLQLCGEGAHVQTVPEAAVNDVLQLPRARAYLGRLSDWKVLSLVRGP